ncbi:isoleucine--tRNA ligase [Holzapfeliella sp. JNUCC 80]
MKLKDTLNLGKTKFPMRGNLPNREGQWQEEWRENKLYEKRLELNEGKPQFILHDGPPFANGNIHMGHALNKISKDFVVRYKSMTGYSTPFIPGWDTHGLPIEQQLAKKGVNRKEISLSEYRDMCRDFAMNEVNKQREDFKRLGVAADWDHPYITLQPEYEAEEVKVFGQMYENGYIYKGKKPVYWSPSSESTLAEAEIEYKDVKSPSMYVAFDLLDGKGILDKDAKLIIWTTTPWTIPSNLAIAVNPRFDYAVVEADGNKYVIAQDLLETVSETLGFEDVKLLKTVKGQDLEYVKVKHPLYDRESLVILGDHVTLDSGTGLVHTAPGHGADDFIAGMKYNLPVLSPIDESGHYTDEAPGFEGVFYDDGNKMVTDKLKENGSLLKLSFFTHSYPHDWRTKKPVIFRATTQWFASIEPFRQNILDEIEKVSFLPEWGKTRLYNMIRDRGDWVISRQRAWGVPLPIFYAENGDAIITKETISHVADLFAKEGSNVWYKRTAKELLPEGFTHEGSPNGEFTKENDIMDVWFDSGSSHTAVLQARPEVSYPADLYLEGSDQYRGWFNSSIITSVAVHGQAPYKSLLSQGFVLDGQGRKMSKSLGNVIEPNKVIKQMGAEIIRLWVSSVDSSADVAVSMEILQQVSEVYRKIRNTMRYMLSNTTDFDPKENRVAFEDMPGADQYIEVRLNQVVKAVEEAYENYDFNDVYKLVFEFITNDLSAFYLDFAKDVVYIESADSKARRTMQTVMYDVLVKLTKLITPILTHTAEEVWSFLKEPEEYAQLTEMPEVLSYDNEAELLEKWAEFMKFRHNVLKSLEEARNQKVIGKSLESKVTIYPDAELKQLLNNLNSDVRVLLITSDLEVSDEKAPENADHYENMSVVVEHAEGEVCPRCRKVCQDTGVNEKLPELCAHCAEIVENDFPEAVAEGFED